MVPVSSAFKILAKPVDVSGIAQNEQINFIGSMVRSSYSHYITDTSSERLVLRFHWIRADRDKRKYFQIYLFRHGGGYTTIPVEFNGEIINADFPVGNHVSEVFEVMQVGILAMHDDLELEISAYAVTNEEMGLFIP